jgi:curved DNA-binding protein CbpA
MLAKLIALLLIVAAASAADDLYQLLGVSKLATTSEIKKAYRRKALDTHPDKNTAIPADEAAESFRRVVHAFEILSDDQSRRHYDRTGRTESSSHTHSAGGVRFTWNYHRRAFKLKDKFEVQQAQSRVIHVVSLQQLETIMLDTNDRLERNLLLCFVKPGKVQELAEDEIVFPYPFAGMSTQQIWWEDLLQTAQIRFHRSNELSRFFGIPEADQFDIPIFLFGKRGQTLAEKFSRIETANRVEFESWVWKQIEVDVEFVNEHPHPVEVYWIHGSRAHIKILLQPLAREKITSMLSHEFWARDARVDTRPDSPGRHKLTNASSLGSWKIVSDASPQEIIVHAKECFDLSGHCGFWSRDGECKKNERFMTETCSLTCAFCSENETKMQEAPNDEL